MRPEDILAFVARRPFRPFRLVRHPELAMVGRCTVAIGIPSPDATEPVYDRLVTISLLHIMQAEPLETPQAPAKG